MDGVAKPIERHTTSEFFLAAYAELRRVAAAQFARLRLGQTLQPTVLVHEAFFKLQADAMWNGSAHFFAAAAQAMREVAVDYLRRKSAQKRGGRCSTVPLADTELDLEQSGLPTDDLLAVDTALHRLAQVYPRKAEIVVMRYFAGMSTEQIAEALEVTPRTVEREWRFARVLLAEALAAERSS